MVYNEPVSVQSSKGNPDKSRKVRLIVLVTFFALLFLGLEVRLITLHIIDSEKLRAKAKEQ